MFNTVTGACRMMATLSAALLGLSAASARMPQSGSVVAPTPVAAPAPAPAPAPTPALSPDSKPACASAVPPTPTPEQIAAYLARPRPVLPSATTPTPIRPGAVSKHECFLAVARRGHIDLLFVGDSITDFFGRADRGQAVWNARYGKSKAANFGISGDTTQDVLWRMQNGELAGFKAKLIVLMLGTNNIGRNQNPDIVAGNAAILAELRTRQPKAKVLILGIFPRGAPGAAARMSLTEINAGLAKLADGKSVFYRDIGSSFLKSDGTLIEGVTVDGLHPSPRGYEIWADALAPTLDRLLK